jgi:hypothetical protein
LSLPSGAHRFTANRTGKQMKARKKKARNGRMSIAQKASFMATAF